MLTTISNQKPADISRFYNDDITKDFDLIANIKDAITSKILNPISPNYDVKITDDKTKKEITENDLISMIIASTDEHINITTEDYLKDIATQTLINYNRNTILPFDDIYAITSSTISNLPEPTATVIYSANQDIIPVTKAFLAGKSDYDTLFTSFAFFAREKTYGAYFANEIEFNNFKDYVKNKYQLIGQILPPGVNILLNQFYQTTLDNLTESFLLRSKEDENNEPLSFARILIHSLIEYEQNLLKTDPDQIFMGTMPFSLSELFIPKTLVLINLEKHSRSTPRQINKEWDFIKNSLQNKPAMISNRKLTKLTTSARLASKINSIKAGDKNNSKTGKSKYVPLRKTAPSVIDTTKMIKRVMDQMSYVNQSQNSYKKISKSFQKPNRRNPDDYNLAGKIASTKYKPDIHLYIDTSGSISEANYIDTVKTCIKIAKKFNINLYFNSFSHVLSQTALLHTKDKSLNGIYKEFQKIPKVDGGTDYENIWQFINASKKRKEELSIIITDFEYEAPNRYIEQPKNLYYLPTATNYNRLKRSADQFMRSMKHNDPNIRTKLLF